VFLSSTDLKLERSEGLLEPTCTRRSLDRVFRNGKEVESLPSCRVRCVGRRRRAPMSRRRSGRHLREGGGRRDGIENGQPCLPGRDCFLLCKETLEFPAAALDLLSTLLPSPPNHLLCIILTYFTNICIRHSSHNHPASIHHMLLRRGGGLPMTPGAIISMLNFTNRSGDGFPPQKKVP
jgi:hypothetical protein